MSTPAPSFRAVDAHTGYLAPGADVAALLPDPEIARLRAELDDKTEEINLLTDLLKASGAHVANLSTCVAMYSARSEDYREQLEEQRYRADSADTRVQELTGELADARAARDTANARASL